MFSPSEFKEASKALTFDDRSLGLSTTVEIEPVKRSFEATSEDQLEIHTDEDAQMWRARGLVWSGTKQVGQFLFEFHSDRAHICETRIATPTRGHGFSKKLLAALERVCADLGLPKITVLAAEAQNHDVMEALGFIPSGDYLLTKTL